jgi:hypothetical protein
MDTDLRALLQQVADGRLDPTEAARLMDAPPSEASRPQDESPATDQATTDQATTDQATTDQATTHRPTADAAPGAPASTPSSVRVLPAPRRADDETEKGAEQGTDVARRLLVRATARSVRVIADRAVATVHVEGPHRTTRDGDLVRVESDLAAPEPGSWSQERPATWWRSFVQTGALGERLVVRVNPELAVEAEVTAGSLDAVGLTHGLRFRVTAGSVRTRDCSGTVDGVVQAGSAKLELLPTGASRVRCESGSVDLRLLPGSDATVRADVELGELKVYDAEGTAVKAAGRDSVVVGDGTATVALDVVMGSAKVRLP